MPEELRNGKDPGWSRGFSRGPAGTQGRGSREGRGPGLAWAAAHHLLRRCLVNAVVVEAQGGCKVHNIEAR